MKTRIIGLFVFGFVVMAGCAKQPAEVSKGVEKVEAETRAEAARKEMDVAPKTFQNRDYFKRNDAPPPPASSPAR